MSGVKWERLALIRTVLLVIAGLICGVVAAFLLAAPAGWAATCAALLLMAYLTDASAVKR